MRTPVMPHVANDSRYVLMKTTSLTSGEKCSGTTLHTNDLSCTSKAAGHSYLAILPRMSTLPPPPSIHDHEIWGSEASSPLADMLEDSLARLATNVLSRVLPQAAGVVVKPDNDRGPRLLHSTSACLVCHRG